MKKLFLVMVVAYVTAGPAYAGPRISWCAHYGTTNNVGHKCGFVSLRKCEADADKHGGYCEADTSGKMTATEKTIRPETLALKNF